MINKFTISISIYLYGILNERQWFFVANIRNTEGAFNKHITKSVYHDFKKFFDVLEALNLNLKEFVVLYPPYRDHHESNREVPRNIHSPFEANVVWTKI